MRKDVRNQEKHRRGLFPGLMVYTSFALIEAPCSKLRFIGICRESRFLRLKHYRIRSLTFKMKVRKGISKLRG